MVKISACVITKNEEKNIGRWLENMKKLADEILVVDTGSTDATVELARQGGAQIFHFTWCDDFSAAKNFAIEKAQGDWILFLDADEYFSPKSLPKVRAVIRKYQANQRVAAIISQWINFDQDDHYRFISAECQARIFRKLPGLRYEGKIHEALSHPGLLDGSLQMQIVWELEIYHTGYSSRIVKEKLARNLLFLQRESREKGEKPEHTVYFMDCYFGLGNYEKAEKYARRALAEGISFNGSSSNIYETLVSSLGRLHRPMAEIYAVLDEAMAKFPEMAEFPLLRAIFAWDDKDYETVENYSRKGLALNQGTCSQTMVWSANNTKRFLPYVYLHLGQLAEMRRQTEQALSYYAEGLRSYPYEAAILVRLYRLIQDWQAVDIIQLLNQLYDKKEDAAFLLQILTPARAGKVYLYYAGQAGLPTDGTAAYMAGGRFDAAAVELVNRLEGLYDLGVWAAPRTGNPQDNVLMTLLLPVSYQKKLQQINIQCPLVSIMIPTYNRPEYFELTLRSAMAQTYANTEILICDNSTDERTAELMRNKGYLQDTRVHYVRNREAKTKAENFAPFEQMARGKYLQWLMDDDVLVKEKLSKMVACLECNPEVRLVTSRRGVMDSEGRLFSAEMLPPTPFDKQMEEYGIYDGREVGRVTLMTANNFLGEPSAVLFRRNDLRHHYWRSDCRGYLVISDVVMWLELLEKGDLAVFRDPLSYFRRHKDQEGQQPDVVVLARIEWFHIIQEYHEQGIFLNDHEYLMALEHLEKDREAAVMPIHSIVKPEIWQRYEVCFQQIKVILERINV